MADQGVLPDNIDEIIRNINLDKSDVISIESSSKDALSDFPTDVSKRPKNDRIFINRWREVLQNGSKLASLPNNERNKFLKDIFLLRSIQKSIVLRKDDGGGEGPQSAKDCLNQYDDCINRYGCDEEETFCICCIPCSYEYMKCVIYKVAGPGYAYSIELPDMEVVLT